VASVSATPHFESAAEVTDLSLQSHDIMEISEVTTRRICWIAFSQRDAAANPLVPRVLAPWANISTAVKTAYTAYTRENTNKTGRSQFHCPVAANLPRRVLCV
jgi:hypothetical protein